MIFWHQNRIRRCETLTIFTMNGNVHAITDLGVDVVGAVFLLLADESVCNERFLFLVIFIGVNVQGQLRAGVRVGVRMARIRVNLRTLGWNEKEKETK